MRRTRSAKIVATLGPSSSRKDQISALAEAGVDVFRFNFSHGSHADHAERCKAVRAVEEERGRPISILMDLQGPKLRVGKFERGRIGLTQGERFRLDLDPSIGDQSRVCLPHPEIFAALRAGADLLLDDGKIRLKVDSHGADFAETRVVAGGGLSDHKGVNVPDVVLPIAAMTEKDRRDLDYGLELGVDWVALSFVQRPKDITDARRLIAGRAAVMSKIEKPAAIGCLDDIIELSDGIMVARGDLGVEIPPLVVERVTAVVELPGRLRHPGPLVRSLQDHRHGPGQGVRIAVDHEARSPPVGQGPQAPRLQRRERAQGAREPAQVVTQPALGLQARQSVLHRVRGRRRKAHLTGGMIIAAALEQQRVEEVAPLHHRVHQRDPQQSFFILDDLDELRIAPAATSARQQAALDDGPQVPRRCSVP